MKQTDLRVIRSKKLIKEAFIDLVEETGYENVTIQDIAQRAMVNRKTFYFHYGSKAKLFEEIIQDMMDLLLEGMDLKKQESGNNVNVNQEIEIAFGNINKNKRLFRVLLNDSSSYELTKEIEVQLLNKIFDRLIQVSSQKNISDIFRQLLGNSMIAIFMVILKWWLDQDDKYSEEFAAETFVKLISNAFTSFLDLE